MALIERSMQLLDRQLAGVKLTLLLNLSTVTVDPKLPSSRPGVTPIECAAQEYSGVLVGLVDQSFGGTNM